MKLSFSSLGCPDYTVDQIVAGAKKYGYDGVEIRTVQNTVKLWELPDLSGAAALKTAKKKFDDAGLEIPVIGASGSFAKAGKDHQWEQTEQLKRYAEIAQGLKSPYMRVFGGPVPEGQTMEECVKWDIEGYEKAIPIMEQFGVTLLLETHDSFSKSESLLPIITGLKGKIGVIWDILHPIRFGEAFEDTARNLKPYIKHVHIKDSKVFNEKTFDFELPGNGSMPIPKLIENLKSISYNGYLSFEWEKGWHPEIPSCEVAFPAYINYIRKYI